MVNISFSWDDGAVEDLKLMDLSLKYKIPGMFFIPATNTERKVLSGENMKKIDNNGFEIGAHTYSHKYLSKLPLNEAQVEIVSGKDYLEQLLGKEVYHFCFPGGNYNSELIDMTRLYFNSARTADTGALLGKDSFLIRPAIHFYDRGKISLLYNSVKNMSLVCPAILKNLSEDRYFVLLKKIIEGLNNYRGTHRIIVWGHSWEIEQFSLWGELEDFFQWLTKNYSSNLRNYSEILSCNNISDI
jgi:peptidoglycan/xylan/chitin deacetylase (PgdA/CDA1 family)